MPWKKSVRVRQPGAQRSCERCIGRAEPKLLLDPIARQSNLISTKQCGRHWSGCCRRSWHGLERCSRCAVNMRKTPGRSKATGVPPICDPWRGTRQLWLTVSRPASEQLIVFEVNRPFHPAMEACVWAAAISVPKNRASALGGERSLTAKSNRSRQTVARVVTRGMLQKPGSRQKKLQTD